MKATQEIKLANIVLVVDYEYHYDSGCWTMRNGDPGWPESEELVITNIITNGNICNLLDSFNTVEEIYSKLEELILSYARNNCSN